MYETTFGRSPDDEHLQRVFAKVTDSSWPFSAMFRDVVEALRQAAPQP